MVTVVPVPLPPGMQLWGKAFDNLDEDVRNRLLASKPHPGDVLIAVRDEAEKGRQKCLRSRFKFTRSNGEVVIVRDVLEKIVRWVDRFKQIGDTAVQYSPEAAALPWAAVRFVLQSAVSEIQYFGAVVADLEIISRLITRHTEFERQFSARTKSVFDDALNEARVGLYAEVLTHLARFMKLFGERTAVRIAKGPFRDIDNDRMRTVLQREDEVLKISSMVGMETLQKLEIAFTRLSISAPDSSLPLADENFDRVRDWLSLSPYNHHHMYVSESRLPGTGQWLLDHPQYVDWHTSSCSSVLLLHGIIGSGKSTLTSLVIDTLIQTATQYPSPAPLAFFYCANPDWERSRASSDNVMHTILGQLCLDTSDGKKVRDNLWAEYERKKAKAKIDGFDMPRLHTQDCVRLVLELAQQDPLTIIVDALDTLDQKERHALTKALNDIVSKADNVVKVFVSTRSDSHLQSTIRADNCINITAEETHMDMKRLIEHRLDTAISNQWLLEGNVSSSLRNILAQSLLEHAGEMFLLVQLQVDRICREHVESDVIRVLETLIPTDLHAVYEEIMDHIMAAGAEAQEIAKRLFSWVLHAQEPLPPSAIVSALAASHGSHITYNQLAKLCANMVVLDAECKVLRFAHQSFQEFLTKRDGFSVVDSHSIIASDCINACSLGLEDHNEPIFPLVAFHDYAAIYWPLHFTRARGSSSYSGLFLKALAFIFDDDFDTSLAFTAWLSRLHIVCPMIPDYHALKTSLNAIPDSDFAVSFLMSSFGMSDLLDAIPLRILEASVDQRNELGHRPLYLAAVFGHATTVALLLGNGAEINIECGRLGSPLHAACFSGHAEVVKQLLEHNADVSCGTLFKDALEASFRGGQEEIALLLMQRNCIEPSGGGYELALQQAAQAGFLRMVNLLQSSPFAPVRGDRNRFQKNTLKAIQGGQVKVLQQFLGDKSDFACLLPPGAVAIAALHNRLEIVEYLLDKGMSIEAQGVFGSPLMSAAMINSSSLVNLLLDRGANVDDHGPTGDAMQVAAAKGHDSVIKILLGQNANVNQKSGFYGYAIQAAAYHGHELTVKLLLDAGAEIRPRSPGHWRDAYDAASEGGHGKITSLFRNRGYHPKALHRPMAKRNARRFYCDDRAGIRQASIHSSSHETVMWNAMAAGRFDRQDRNRKKTDILQQSTHPSSYETVMWISELSAIYTPASGIGHFQQMQTLLCDWPTPNPVKDITPQMALLSAIYHEYIDLMKFLVEEFSLDVNNAMFSRSVWHHRALAEVATALEIMMIREQRSLAMVHALLETGATIPPDDQGWGRLLDSVFFFSYPEDMGYEQNAFEYGLGATLTLLLSKAPERKAEGPRFGLALLMAATIDHHSLVDLLLARQVDVNFVAPFHGTALHAVSFRGHLSMAQKLLDAGANVHLGEQEPVYVNSEAPMNHELRDCIMAPIHAAAFNGHSTLVKKLIDRGAIVNEPGLRGVTPLDLASAGSHLQTMRALLDAGADIGRCRALQHAISPEAVEFLLARGAKVTPELNLAYKMTHGEAGLERVCRLFQNACTYDTWNTIVQDSLETELPTDSTFQYLLASTTPTTKLFILACKRGFISSIKLMVQNNTIEINGRDEESGDWPLRSASSALQVELVSYLLDVGAKVNSPDSSLSSPLVAALAAGLDPGTYQTFVRKAQCEEVTRLLVQNGADVNDDSRPPGPPLHIACLLRSTAMVTLLLDAGASLDTTAGEYEHAIFAAIKGGDPDVIRLVLSRAPQIGYQHSKHGTPLHYARSLWKNRHRHIFTRWDEANHSEKAKIAGRTRVFQAYAEIQTMLEESNQV